MSPPSWMRALAWLMPLSLWCALASGVRADAARVVLWVAGSESDADERERALRLELEARGILLLTAQAAAATDQPGTEATNPAALARELLARSEASAVLWLEGDATRPVSWLRVIHRRADAVEQAPLPHPPEAIEPELFAIAAASLLEQVLESPAAAPVAARADLQVNPYPAAIATAPVLAPAAQRAQPRLLAKPPRRAPARSATHWFVQIAMDSSIADVHSGMEASTRPTLEQIFDEEDGRFFFDDTSAWVPDADSFDDFENEEAGIPRGTIPVPGNCRADGKATGPADRDGPDGEPFTQLEPSRYCARVEQPGFEFVPALRLVFGRWLLDRLALGVVYQWHFSVDPNHFLGNQLFGLQAEYLALGDRGRGVAFSLLTELSVGRDETRAPSPRAGQSVNVLSGPFGLSGGALLRAWPVPGFALFLSPIFGVRFPAAQFTADLAAGVEVPF